MNVLDKWLKPKWQHPDASIRLKALAESPIDAADCRTLAIDDPDPQVRDQAVGRLQSVDDLLHVLHAQPTARAAVGARLTTLLQQTPTSDVGTQLDVALGAVDPTTGLTVLALQAADPEMRAAAIARLSDGDTLRRCALEDKAAEVRAQAVQRIVDETTLDEVGRTWKGRDKTVARLATQRLTDLRMQRERRAECTTLLDELDRLTRADPFDPEAVVRTRTRWEALQDTADSAQRARHASLAPQLDARLAALHEAQRQDLEHKLGRERLLAQLRQLRHDLPGAEPAQARAALQIIRHGWAQATALQDPWTERRLQEEWQEAATQVEAALQARERASRQEQAIMAAIRDCEAVLERGAPATAQVDAARGRCSELVQRLGDIPACERPLQRLQQLVERMAAERAGQQDRVRTLRQRVKEALEALEQALEKRQLDPAIAAHKRVSALLADGADHPELKALQRRLAKCEPALRELQSWRDWGSDKAREELIDEARRLVDAEIPVEQRAKALKGLRGRWKALGGGGPKVQRLWEAFDTACTAAHEPIKQDRREQARQRERHLEARAEICAGLERLAADTDWSTPDWRTIDRQLSAAKRQWRDAGGVPHKKWHAIVKRFDQAVSGVEQHLAKERRHNLLQRQALVREAEALGDQSDLRQAVAEARRLREAWQVTAPSTRKDERALWQAFNAALDGVFKRDRAVRDEFKAGLEQHRRQAEALCAELEALSAAPQGESRALRAELTRLTGAFGQLGTLPKNARQGLERRFREACDGLRKRIAAAESADALQALIGYQTLHGLCEQAEALAQSAAPDGTAVEALRAAWQAADKPAVNRDLLQALEQRWTKALGAIDGTGPPPDPQTLANNLDARRRICLDLEILRKHPSPSDSQTARMQRQVVLLEAAMKGDDEPQQHKVDRLQIDYLCQGPVPADQQQALAERFARVFP